MSIFVVWFSEGLLPSVCGAFYVSNFYALSGLICVYRLYGSVHVFSLVFLFIFYTVFFIISMCFVMWFDWWTQCMSPLLVICVRVSWLAQTFRRHCLRSNEGVCVIYLIMDRFERNLWPAEGSEENTFQFLSFLNATMSS